MTGINSALDRANKAAAEAINAVQREITSIQNTWDNLYEGLNLELQNLGTSLLQQAVTLAEQAVEEAKKDSATLTTMRTMLAEAKKAGKAVIADIQEKLLPPGSQFHLKKATLTGFITPQMTELPPFDLYVEGAMGTVVFRHTWKWKPWTPGKDSNALFTEIGPVILKVLKDAL